MNDGASAAFWAKGDHPIRFGDQAEVVLGDDGPMAGTINLPASEAAYSITSRSRWQKLEPDHPLQHVTRLDRLAGAVLPIVFVDAARRAVEMVH